MFSHPSILPTATRSGAAEHGEVRGLPHARQRAGGRPATRPLSWS
ncbi:hypothetical protein UO65_5706 [Actinokineospora spheciospongiae]|uniref:Uncharacterized protein n=1 Tax=Actinokineospora spheciospongiae TaxID=909613 RepID=W7IYA9_9PSEU|nr:hypothetical protein UO65_5706 [Actinokineospora spheciospongiae]